MVRRAGAFLLAMGIVVASCFAALIGLLWGFELKCDDSCSIGDIHDALSRLGLTSNAERGWQGIVLLVLAGALAIALRTRTGIRH